MRNDFDFLHGTWDIEHVQRRRWLDGCDDWDTSAGGGVCAPILGGLGNFEQIWIAERGVVGATLRLFDAEAGHWTIYWAGVAGGRLDPPMTGRFAAGVGTFFGTDTVGGVPVEVRFVWDDISPTTARWTQSFAPTRTGSTTDWEENWVMRFRKVSADADAATTRSGVVPASATLGA